MRKRLLEVSIVRDLFQDDLLFQGFNFSQKLILQTTTLPMSGHLCKATICETYCAFCGPSFADSRRYRPNIRTSQYLALLYPRRGLAVGPHRLIELLWTSLELLGVELLPHFAFRQREFVTSCGGKGLCRSLDVSDSLLELSPPVS